jgi:hypothetical protein
MGRDGEFSFHPDASFMHNFSERNWRRRSAVTEVELSDTQKAANAIVELAKAIIEEVEAAPMGIPTGHLYATMMGLMSLHTFNMLIDFVLATGEVRRDGDLLVKA